MPRKRQARTAVTGTAVRTGFRLELDLVLHFVPPMDERGPGITLTRTLELPFAPYSGLVIYSRRLDSFPDPLGFHLNNVVPDKGLSDGTEGESIYAPFQPVRGQTSSGKLPQLCFARDP